MINCEYPMRAGSCLDGTRHTPSIVENTGPAPCDGRRHRAAVTKPGAAYCGVCSVSCSAAVTSVNGLPCLYFRRMSWMWGKAAITAQTCRK